MSKNSIGNRKQKNLLDDKFGSMLQLHDWALGAKKNTTVKAFVLFVDSDFVTVDAGLKSEARIPTKDFDGNIPQVNDVINLYVVSIDSNGEAVFSVQMAKFIAKMDVLKEKMEQKLCVSGFLTGKNSKGYTVNINGLNAFLPRTQVRGQSRINNEKLGDKPFDFYILELDEKSNDIIVSMLGEGEVAPYKSPLESNIKEKDVVTGKVIEIEDFGAYLDIDGYLGFIRLYDFFWSRINHPQDVVSLGQEIKVKILKVEKNRFKCGVKQLDTEAIQYLEEKYKIGSVFKGKVVSIVNNGLFVMLDGIDGFVDNSEVSWNELEDMNQKYKINDEVEVKVLSVSANKISLSIKQCKENLFTSFTEGLSNNQILKVEARKINKHKIIVKINNDLSGFIEVMDLAWNYNDSISILNEIKNGIKNENYVSLEAKIVEVDNALEKIRLSVKHIKNDPVEEFLSTNNIGSKLSAVVSQIVDTNSSLLKNSDDSEGIYVTINEFENIVFVPINDFSKNKEECKITRFKIGEEVNVKIYKVDRKSRKIFGSIRSYLQETNKEYQKDRKFTKKKTKDYKKPMQKNNFALNSNDLEF